jgi:hypothetical protein
MLPKRFKTESLFYKKYTCKALVHNSLAMLFRNKNLPRIKKHLDVMQQQAEAGLPLHHPTRIYGPTITLEDFQDACLIHEALKSLKGNFTLRVEGYSLSIFTNDADWIENLSKKIYVLEFYSPENEEHEVFLKNNIDVIVVDDEPSFVYKVYFRDNVEKGFAQFAERNPDKIKIGKIALDAVKNNYLTTGLYFWARDEKILSLAQLALGGGVKRIVKHVSKINIDTKK